MLKLVALDADDLAVISAQMQDAVLLAGDISYSRKRRQFALVANRYAWDEASGKKQRHRTGLNFDRVTAVQAHGIDPARRDAVLSLLAITFAGREPPGGTITLAFSGGGAIRLDIECIEARLSDMGPVWDTAHQPQHPEA